MKHLFLYVLLFVVSITISLSQEISISLGSGEIAANQTFTITVTVENDRIKEYDNFPDIRGFNKAGTSSSSSTNIVNGRISSSQSVSQNYVPTKEGTYTLHSFTMVVNGKKVTSKGKSIKVGPPRQQRRSNNLFDDFFGRSQQVVEYIDIEDDAFLALTVNKNEVYIGEGFTATLAFYVSESNKAPMSFFELSEQLTEIAKQLKPANCWEESFLIDQIEKERVTIKGKNYTRHKLYQTSLFPLTLDPITIPSIGLKMIKYKVSKQQSFFGRSKQEDYKTYYTSTKTIKVKDLPSHPLKDQVSVGVYKLNEKIDRTSLLTGESFQYEFKIEGEGNISSLHKPDINVSDNFEFYPPNTLQNIQKSYGKVMGSKVYSYYGIPKEPGEFALGDYVSWIYFNTSKEAYDTLMPNIKLIIKGESKRNQAITSNDLGSFYDMIDHEDNELGYINENDTLNILGNIIVLALFSFTCILWYRSKKRYE